MLTGSPWVVAKSLQEKYFSEKAALTMFTLVQIFCSCHRRDHWENLYPVHPFGLQNCLHFYLREWGPAGVPRNHGGIAHFVCIRERFAQIREPAAFTKVDEHWKSERKINFILFVQKKHSRIWLKKYSHSFQQNSLSAGSSCLKFFGNGESWK